MEQENKKQTWPMRFDIETLEQLREAAYRARISMAELVRRAVVRELKRKPKKKKGGSDE